MKLNRKQFLRYSGAMAGGTILMTGLNPANSTSTNTASEAKLGMASYTLRKFSPEEAIQMTKDLGLGYISLKSFHLPYDAPESRLKEIVSKAKAAGLVPYGVGVVYMKTEKEVNHAFDYAKTAGIDTIVGVPNYELLPLVNQKVKDYNIKVAIHNHGPGDDLYASPTDVMEKIKDLDKRIGLCMDIGHTVRIKEDPAALAKKYASRLMDVHIKDVTKSSAEGKTVEIGRGIINIGEFLTTLNKIGYNGVIALEYEKDENDPMRGAAESVGYVKGVLSMI
jgi:sugar phosphate isomerase/epimerase